jgi:hypothetical protein
LDTYILRIFGQPHKTEAVIYIIHLHQPVTDPDVGCSILLNILFDFNPWTKLHIHRLAMYLLLRWPNNYYHENETVGYLCTVTLYVAVNNINVETITSENEPISPICIVTQQLLCGDFKFAVHSTNKLGLQVNCLIILSSCNHI